MMRVLFVLLLLAAPSWATTDAWPALYEVVGVEEDDVLNIRSGPGTEYEIIATLPHDATNIEVIEPNDDFTWARVATGEGMGWVSMDFIVPLPEQWDGKYPEFASCAGTEPFWRLTRGGGQMSLRQISAETEETYPIDWEGGTISHRGRHSFRAGNLVGILSNQLCGDGMSDRDYGWEVNLILLGEGSHLQGCCTLAPD